MTKLRTVFARTLCTAVASLLAVQSTSAIEIENEAKVIETTVILGQWLRKVDEREKEATKDVTAELETARTCRQALESPDKDQNAADGFESEFAVLKSHLRMLLKTSRHDRKSINQVKRQMSDNQLGRKLALVSDQEIRSQGRGHYDALLIELDEKLQVLKAPFAQEREKLIAKAPGPKRTFNRLLRSFIQESNRIKDISIADKRVIDAPPGMALIWRDESDTMAYQVSMVYTASSAASQETSKGRSKKSARKPTLLNNKYEVTSESKRTLVASVGKFRVSIHTYQPVSSKRPGPKQALPLLIDLDGLAQVGTSKSQGNRSRSIRK